MIETLTPDPWGALTAPDALTIQRLLPGPLPRVWAHLAEGDLRRRWLASGDLDPTEGAALELVWRNDELTDPPGTRPEGAACGESRMQSRVLAIDPPRRLVIAWGAHGEVAFELAEAGDRVLLTLVHRRIPDRATLLSVSTGWHAHLDVLAARLADETPEPFWDAVRRLRPDYERRLPG